MGRPRLSFLLTYLILDVVQHSIMNSDVFTFDLNGTGKKGKAGRAGRENSEGMEKRLWGEEREGSGGGEKKGSEGGRREGCKVEGRAKKNVVWQAKK